MPVYMVERVLPGITLESLDVLRTAAGHSCSAFVQRGQPVQYLRSTFTPSESRCCCLFEAADADLVRQVNDAAQLPYRRIILALDLDSAPGFPHTGEER